MKVAFFSDSKINSGGSLHVTFSAAKILNKLNIEGIDVDFVVTQKSVYKELTSKYHDKIKFFDENYFLNKVSSILYRNFFYKKIYHKFSLNNCLETFAKENKYDLIFFITPSPLVLLCNKINFIYSIWEFSHKEYPALPEYDENTISNRELYYAYACNHAFKVILFNEKSKKDFLKYYLINETRIETFFFSPDIVDYTIGSNLNIENIIKKKEYIFYPAQFWPHKNHIYLLHALKEYNLKQKEKIYLVLTGHDKGSLNLIKIYIKKLNMGDEVIIFNYLDKSDLCYLYKNCFAVVFPSLIGSQSLPLLEAFFFNKPIIYNEKTLDSSYQKATLALNIDDIHSLGLNIEKLKKNSQLRESLVQEGKKIYNETLNFNNIELKLKKILKEYYFFNKN
jgi:glycosyltransferase involved in cell wall biosynthesis